MSNYSKEDFKLVGQDRKVYDQKMEGKPIGYFKDAMIRFRKNKMNIVAAVLLSLLILLAILVPAFTKKNYQVIEEQLTYLSPRVPILEKFGILDGKRKLKDQVVDLSTVDDKTGLGIPEGILEDYIVEGTLTNYRGPSNDTSESSLGGQVVFAVDAGEDKYVVKTTNEYLLKNEGVNFTIDVADVSNLGENGYGEVYIRYKAKKLSVAKFTEKGIVEAPLILDGGNVNSEIFVEVFSENPDASVTIQSIKVHENDTLVTELEGYNLYSLEYLSGKGASSRINHYRIYASFTYDQYGALFSSRKITLSGSEYDKLMEGYEHLDPIEDPEKPGEFYFEEDITIKRILSMSELEIASEMFRSYEVIVDYAGYMGYSKTPYFLFGTDASGKDLFALTWAGLRTSLVIGIVVSAINISIGVVYGAISGYYGGKVDLIMERFTEIIGRIPWLVTLSIFSALIGPGFLTLIIILIISGWIGVASVTRTQFYRYKGREYVLASRTLGAKDSRLIFRHILPNGIGTIITSSVLMIPGVIFSESSISYLGFGIGHGQDINLGIFKLSGVSIGVLLADGQTALLDYPHLTVYPAIIISILMITFNIFGNGLRDAFNPSLRGAE